MNLKNVFFTRFHTEKKKSSHVFFFFIFSDEKKITELRKIILAKKCFAMKMEMDHQKSTEKPRKAEVKSSFWTSDSSSK